MIVSQLILLLFISKIHRLGATKSTSLVIGDSAEVKMENFLVEFIADLKKFCFDKLDHHGLTVLGKKEHFLQATKSLLESGTPYFVSREAETTALPLYCGADGVVLFFIDGFSDSEMSSTFAKLPNDFKCKSLLISFDENRTVKSLDRTIASAVKAKHRNVLLALSEGRVIKIYGKTLNANCREEMTLLSTWIPKTRFGNNENILEYRKGFNARGCPMLVSTFALSPTMILREDETNKSWRIGGGVEGRLVKSVAEHLNVLPVVKVPSVKEQLWVTPDGAVLGIVGEVAGGSAGLGIGQIRPTLERAMLVDFTQPCLQVCAVWVVPRSTIYKSSTVLSEFSSTTWILVILSVSLCCGLAYAIPNLRIGYRSSLNIFDVIAVTLNYAIPRRPSGLLGKLFFLLYVQYSRVISTAYSTSLSSILTTTTPEPTIVDEVGILDAGLRVAGSESSREMLSSQIPPNSTRAELISRYVVITSLEAALARISDRRDIAYLGTRSTISFAAKELSSAGKEVKFYSLPGCINSYYSVMVTPKGSPLTDQVNNVVLRLREAGIYNHWMNLEGASESHVKTRESIRDMLLLLESVFLLYLCCLIPALWVFFAELVVWKLKIDWFTC